MKKQQVVETDPTDRISRLPEPILHHILSCLPQKDAVGTCVLSKSWGYIVSTRPILEFRDHLFKRNRKTMMSFLDNTLQRYHDRKLSIQNCCLEIWSSYDSEYVALLDKWIPIVLLNMGVETFSLCFHSKTFDLPWLVFKAKSLRKLVLHGCHLKRINPLDDEKILLKHLQTLSLTKVDIADETFHNIMSSCPLIEYVTLHECHGLVTITVNKAAYNLKHFDFRGDYEGKLEEKSIEIDAPTIEHFHIKNCMNWYHHHNYFPHLKSLCLFEVRLSTESLDGFSCNFPCLEVLRVYYCYGFEEFRLASRSIKHLVIWDDHKSIKVAINAPDVLKFDYTCIIPQSFSFTTNSSECKSNISLWPHASCFHKLHEMLNVLSQSKIYLSLYAHSMTNLNIYGDFYEPIYVWRLDLQLQFCVSSSISSALIDNLFRICHPRIICHDWYVHSRRTSNRDTGEVLTELMWKILVMEREKRDYVWKQDLEEVSMEAFDWDGQEWHPVVWTGLLKCAALWPDDRDGLKVRFRLKWREFR